MSTSDLAAVVHAGSQGATIFRYLLVGERFRFATPNSAVYVKTASRRYRLAEREHPFDHPQAFMTGARSAVVRVP